MRKLSGQLPSNNTGVLPQLRYREAAERADRNFAPNSGGFFCSASFLN
jgi:hypothetical protein